MEGQGLVEFGQARLEQFFHHLGDGLVDGAPLRFEQGVVDHLLSEGVFEHVFQVRLRREGMDEIGTLQAAQALVQTCRICGDFAQHLMEEGAADHRGLLQHAPVVPLQPIHPGGDHPLHRGGDLHFAQRSGEAPVAVLPHQRLGLDQRDQHLLHVKRIALRQLPDVCDQSGRRCGPAQQGLGQLPRLAGRETFQFDLPVSGHLPEIGLRKQRERRAVGGQGDGWPGEMGQDVAEQFHRGRVRPVQVLDEEHRRSHDRHGLEDCVQRFLNAILAIIGGDLGGRLVIQGIE